MTSSSVVIIPSDETMIEVLWPGDDINVRRELEHRCLEYPSEKEPVFVSMRVDTEGQVATVEFLWDSALPINVRARNALAHLNGVHMIFTGPAAISGLSPDRTIGLIRALS